VCVWILSEWRKDQLEDISLCLLGEGKRITDSRSEKLSALVLRERSKEQIQKLFSYGAEEVIQVDLPSEAPYNISVTSEILAKLINDYRPRLLLFAASHLSNEIAGRLSIICRAGLVINANRLELKGGQEVIVKNTFGDRIENRVHINTGIQLVTLKAKELQSTCPNSRCEGKLIEPKIVWNDNGRTCEIVDYVRGDPKKIGLGDAYMIVAGGKGVGGQKQFELIHELSDVLEASVGGSREAIDRKWLHFNRQIGQTGKTVSPMCLITVGISGAIQFLKGIEDAKYVLAINNDKRASIFNYADLKILGDLHEIVPVLIKYIEQLDNSNVEIPQR